MPEFVGFSDDALAFFEELARENTKPFWEKNKARYERVVRGPFAALLEELDSEFGPPKLHRPYRDIRFSKDKSPYRTDIAGELGGAGPRHGFVRLDAEGMGAASGIYTFLPDQLERYRAAVAADATGIALVGIVEAIRQHGLEVHPEGLKTAPRGFAKDHPRIGLLRRTGLIGWRAKAAGPWLETREPIEFVRSTLEACVYLNRWLAENVGPTTLEAKSRR